MTPLEQLRQKALTNKTVAGQKIYAEAVKRLNTDVSPNDLAPDEFGCAETFSNLVNDAGYKMPIYLGTGELGHYLKTDPGWVPVTTPSLGDAIICITGEGGKGGVTNGHVGVFLSLQVIASNDSATGLFKKNYTLDAWKSRWGVRGGYPIYFFRRVDLK